MTISLDTAIKLKQAGLAWTPQTHDFFAIPDVEMDEKIFAMSDMTVSMEVLDGYQAITFNGAVEWALDFIYKSDAIWLPTESQLRNLLVSYLGAEPKMMLQTSIGGYVVTITHQDSRQPFEGITAEEAYAAAILATLDQNDQSS
ncbi:MAG: pilus assembly protein CpaE [Chloroflexota bacterium]